MNWIEKTNVSEMIWAKSWPFSLPTHHRLEFQAADCPTTAPSPIIIFLSWLPKPISNPKRNYPPLKEHLKLDKNVGVNVGWVKQMIEKRLNYSDLQKSVKESRGAKPSFYMLPFISFNAQ